MPLAIIAGLQVLRDCILSKPTSADSAQGPRECETIRTSMNRCPAIEGSGSRRAKKYRRDHPQADPPAQDVLVPETSASRLASPQNSARPASIRDFMACICAPDGCPLVRRAPAHGLICRTCPKSGIPVAGARSHKLNQLVLPLGKRSEARRTRPTHRDSRNRPRTVVPGTRQIVSQASRTFFPSSSTIRAVAHRKRPCPEPAHEFQKRSAPIRVQIGTGTEFPSQCCSQPAFRGM